MFGVRSGPHTILMMFGVSYYFKSNSLLTGRTYNLDIQEDYFILSSLPPDTEFKFQVRVIYHKLMNLIQFISFPL